MTTSMVQPDTFHMPWEHHKHKLPNCGCAEPEKAKLVCKECGACYDGEPLAFTRWRCYDCGGIDSLCWKEGAR